MITTDPRQPTRPSRWSAPDPQHVIGPRWLGIYHNPNDPRLIVPRPIRWMGLTLNLAHRGTRFCIAGIVFVLILGLALLLT